MLPRVVAGFAELEMEHGAPLRPLWFVEQFQARLAWRAVALAAVARDAGADDVFPRGLPTPVTRNDVIKVEILAVVLLATILAGIVIPLENVVAGKFHFLLRHSIEEKE